MVTTTNNLDSPADFLKAAYKQLAFDQGTLLSAVGTPQSGALEDWVDRGDWQSLAAQVGAECIFFGWSRSCGRVRLRTEDNRLRF